jgi:hypothetical protein
MGTVEEVITRALTPEPLVMVMKMDTKELAQSRRTTRALALRERGNSQRHSQAGSSTLGVTKVGLGNTTKSTTHPGRGAITGMGNTALTIRQVKETTMENTTDSNHLRRKPDTLTAAVYEIAKDNSGQQWTTNSPLNCQLMSFKIST